MYITTVQALHQLVGEVLGPVRPPSLAYPELREWLDRLESRIDLATEAIWPHDAIRDRLRRSEEEELPFNLLASEVEIAASRFAVTGPGQVIAQTLLRRMALALDSVVGLAEDLDETTDRLVAALTRLGVVEDAGRETARSGYRVDDSAPQE